MTVTAFHGDASLKARSIARLRDHVASGRFRFSPPWQDGQGSAMGVIAESDDAQVYADRLGYPVALALVLDLLVNFRADGDATDFAVRWLDETPVGADLSTIPTALTLELLTHSRLIGVTERFAPIETVRRQIADLHRRDGAGDAAGPDSWRKARREAVAIADTASDGDGRDAARVVEAAAWPGTIRTTLYDTLNALTLLDKSKSLRDLGWTNEDERTAFAAIEAIARDSATAGVPPAYDRLLTAMAVRDPELAERFAARSTVLGSRSIHTHIGDGLLSRFRTAVAAGCAALA